MIKEIDELLEYWGDWYSGHVDQSAIGYPSKTVEARAMDGMISGGLPAHSICPEVAMPPRVAKVDRLMRHAPDKVQKIARQHYVVQDRRTGSWYWTRVDMLHLWLHGALAGERDRDRRGG